MPEPGPELPAESLFEDFEDLYENAPCGYLSIGRQGRIFKTNRTLSNWLGYAPGELIGKRWHDLLKIAGRIFFETHFAPLLRMQGFFNEVALDLVAKDGKTLSVLVNAVERRDKDGKALFIRMTVFNATDRRRYERELLEARATAESAAVQLKELNAALEGKIADAIGERLAAEEALRQSQKLEAIGQLTGGVAHDFNNLLTIIRGSVDLLRKPALPEARRNLYIQAISDTVTRAAKLTSQLLAFARRQALKPEIFDAGHSIASMSGMLKTLTGSRIVLTLADTPEEACLINADPSQFDTALVNLVANARDAMNGEGRLTVKLQSVSAIPAGRTQKATPGGYVAVSVSDTGCGIPPEKIDHIFEPFFTTKPIGQGTGLGLSQVFGFAKQSGGDVHVDSVVGQGTTFTIYLPRAVGQAHAEDAELDDGSLVDGQGAWVLVVEDNPEVGAFATQTLSELGYRPVLAATADEALADLAKNPGRFDVVFSDVVMPGMNGIELAQEIRRLHTDLPVVLTSGYSDVLARDGTLGLELLHKPYAMDQLSRVLRKAISWRARVQKALPGSAPSSR